MNRIKTATVTALFIGSAVTLWHSIALTETLWDAIELDFATYTLFANLIGQCATFGFLSGILFTTATALFVKWGK